MMNEELKHLTYLCNQEIGKIREKYKKLNGLFAGFVDYTQYFKNKNHEIWEEITQKIIDFQPDWVGYTSYTANVTSIDIISQKIKKRDLNYKGFQLKIFFTLIKLAQKK